MAAVSSGKASITGVIVGGAGLNLDAWKEVVNKKHRVVSTDSSVKAVDVEFDPIEHDEKGTPYIVYRVS